MFALASELKNLNIIFFQDNQAKLHDVFFFSDGDLLISKNKENWSENQEIAWKSEPKARHVKVEITTLYI